VYDNVTYHDTTPLGHSQQLPKLPPDKPGAPTDLETIEAKLGPFQVLQPSSSNRPDTAYPAVLIIRQDGSTGASKDWTVPFDARTWSPQEPIQITGYNRSGDYETFSTGPDRAYTVRLGQAFVLETMPQQVFAFNAQGKPEAISGNQAIVIRQHI